MCDFTRVLLRLLRRVDRMCSRPPRGPISLKNSSRWGLGWPGQRRLKSRFPWCLFLCEVKFLGDVAGWIMEVGSDDAGF